MHIINIGTPILDSIHYKVSSTNFLSGTTFLDAEIIFWDVESSYSELLGNNYSINKTFGKDQILHLQEKIEVRKKEFEEFFEIGRTLIMTSPMFYDYKYTFQNDDSEIIINYIDSLDIPKPILEHVSGHVLEAVKDEIIESYYENIKDFLFYKSRIDNANGNALLYIKDTKYLISEYYKIKNGLLIILPNLKFNQNDPTRDSNDFLFSTEGFIEELKLNIKPKSLELPSWVNDYVFEKEKNELGKNVELNRQLIKIKDEISKSNDEISKFNFLKSLFAADGDILEDAVELILKEIGFSVQRQITNRDDLIIKLGDNVAVVEIKGLTKSAAEKNAAQLEKWVSNYHAEYDKEPKGILIINTYKNKVLEERKERDFPEQMMSYVKRKEQCVLTGIQLLCIYLDFQSKKLKTKDVEKMLFETIGELIYTKNPLELILRNKCDI